MSYADQKVLVLGMGRSGQAAAKLLIRDGAKVVAYDSDPARLEDAPPVLERLSGPELPDFDRFDRVVSSPGIPIAPHPKLMPEIDLAADHLTMPIIGVTGTNGKSTATVLIASMLDGSGIEAAAGGNLGTPLCDLVGTQAAWVVAECSSFQLEHSTKLSPRVVVLLNLAPDHLDRHGSLAAYGAAKARLASGQGETDILVPCLDDEWAQLTAKSSRARVSGFSTVKYLQEGAFLDGDDLVLSRSGREILRMAISSLSAACRYPIANALAASTAALAAGATADGIRSGLSGFEGLPHRAQLICTRNGVRYVDDSKATNPAAAASSLASETAPTWWIAGGRAKGIAFDSLVDGAASTRAALVFGEAAASLQETLRGVTEVVRVASLDAAVQEAGRRARTGDVVLLSPACASFDQFASFEERGRRFADLARALPC